MRLGCVIPGESVATFGDALNRLSDRSTYLYQDNARYWYRHAEREFPGADALLQEIAAARAAVSGSSTRSSDHSDRTR